MSKLSFTLFLVLLLSSTFIAFSQADEIPCTSRTPMCTRIYAPVCGRNNIQCIRAPCPNTKTYSNACVACSNEDVLAYTPGACPQDAENEGN